MCDGDFFLLLFETFFRMMIVSVIFISGVCVHDEARRCHRRLSLQSM